MDQPMETEICHNCKREVPQANYLIHVAHCAKNMAVCPVCGDAVPKAHLQAHRAKEHSLVECKACRHKVQSGALEHHRATQCGKRTVPCSFCELELPKSDMADHENYCGSRTERCDECGELIMLKYKKLHEDSNHGFLKLDDEPGPTPSWEIPSRRSPPLASMSSIRAVLPRTDPVLERNVNFVPVENKTSYKAPIPSDPSAVPNRQPITPYDATEDIRAKVKLARHDLNEIKQSYLSNEKLKERLNENLNRDVPAAARRLPDKFVTNLVPYEKNQSYKVNATPLEDNPKNYYNYLGEKESPTKTFIPLSNAGKQKNFYDHDEVDKVAPKAPVRTKIRDEKNRAAEASTSGASEHRHKPRNTDRSRSNESSPAHRTGATPKKVASPTNGAVPKKEQGAVPKRRKAPPPPIVNIQKDGGETAPSAETNEVQLPCEFCEKMIPASVLVQHETGCRPDLARVNANVHVDRANVSARPQSNPEVELPCEFCFSLIPASKLLSHQALCDVEAN